MATQLQSARAGKITDEVKFVAKTEGIDVEVIRDEIAAGRLVIPANKLHLKTNLKPIGIGRILTTKVNANIGTSSVRSSIEAEIEKMQAALAVGADAIMDLSTGGNLDETRTKLLSQCPVPFGTVPIYQVIEGRNVEDIDHKTILDCFEKQAKQGVDFFTVHAGVLKEYLPLLEKRVMGIVSRGGALLAKWMLYHNKQNPLYEMFDDLCGIMAEYDVCFSLGDGLRPGAIADATDEAQMAELRTLGELTAKGAGKGLSGYGGRPRPCAFRPDTIQYGNPAEDLSRCSVLCSGAIGNGYCARLRPYNIGNRRDRRRLLRRIVFVLCHAERAPGLPDADDVRAGVIAAKIAAHAADVARGLKGAAERDRKLSIARSNLDWKTHFAESLDPQTAERMHREACKEIGEDKVSSADYCSMCGQQWCSVRINREIRKAISR